MKNELETLIVAYRGLSDEEDEGAVNVPDGDESLGDDEDEEDADGVVDEDDEEEELGLGEE